MSKHKIKTVERHNSKGNGVNGNHRTLSEEDFAKIYATNYQKMLYTSRRILRNTEDAEDAVQDAFLKFFIHYNQYRGDSNVSTYLHRIVANESLMKLRYPERKAHKVPLEHRFADDLTIEIPELAVDCSGQDVDRINIERAVSQLPDGYRRVLILSDYLGCKHHEVVEILGYSIGNSKSQLYKARRKLRELLHQNQEIGPQKNKNNGSNGSLGLHEEAAYLQQVFLLTHPDLAKYAIL